MRIIFPRRQMKTLANPVPQLADLPGRKGTRKRLADAQPGAQGIKMGNPALNRDRTDLDLQKLKLRQESFPPLANVGNVVRPKTPTAG